MSKSIGRSRSRTSGLTLIGILMAATSVAAQTAAPRKLTLADLYRLREVSAPELSPDGGWVAYTVGTTDSVKDRTTRDLFMTSWDGRQTLRLTTSPSSEGTPRWSPDGRYLAFLSDREDPHEVQQVWLLNREGGEAERITNLPGGVSQYAWSPDSKRLALIASDPNPDTVATGSDTSTRRTPPIVINRFQFKEDETGYLGKRTGPPVCPRPGEP